MTQKLLTVAEAAERIARTESQMRWLIHSKQAPKSAMIGGRRYFREADIDAFIAAAFDDEPVSA